MVSLHSAKKTDFPCRGVGRKIYTGIDLHSRSNYVGVLSGEIVFIFSTANAAKKRKGFYKTCSSLSNLEPSIPEL